MDYLFKAAVAYGAIALAVKAFEPKDKPPKKKTREVYLIGSPVEFGRFRIPKALNDFIIEDIGITVEGIIHWGVVVRDELENGAAAFTQYDLWSAWPPFKNELRKRPVTRDIAEAHTHVYKVGETDKTDQEMMNIANRVMAQYPIYGVKGNCQHFATKFLSEVLEKDIEPISSLETQLRKISPSLDAFELITHATDKVISRIGRNEEVGVNRVKEKLLSDEL